MFFHNSLLQDKRITKLEFKIEERTADIAQQRVTAQYKSGLNSISRTTK